MNNEEIENIKIEVENFEKTINENLMNLSNISLFIKTFINSLKNNFLNLNFDLNSYNFRLDNQIQITTYLLFNSYRNFISKINKIIKEFDKIIISIDELESSTKERYNNNLNKLKLLKDNLITEKTILNKSYEQYNQDCFNEENLNLDKNTNINYLYQQDAKVLNSKKLYIYQLKKYNLFVDDINKEYSIIKESEKEEEKAANYLIQQILLDFKNGLNNFGSNLKDLVDVSYFQTDDIFKNDKNNNNNSETEKKFKYAEFQDYNKDLIKNETNIKIDDDFSEMKSIEKKELKKFVEKLTSKDLIQDSLITEIINYCNESKSNIKNINEIYNKSTKLAQQKFEQSNAILFLNFLKEYSTVELDNNEQIEEGQNIILFQNYQNFKHFSNILNNVAIIFSETNFNYKVNRLVIEILEKTNYNGKLLTYYFSVNNQFFQTKNFWIKFFEENINYEVTKKIKSLLNQKKIISDKHKNKNIDFWIDKTKITKIVTIYSKIKKSYSKKIEIQKFLKIYMKNLMNEILIHMTNFSVQSEEIFDLIKDLSNNYNFLEEEKSYYYNLALFYDKKIIRKKTSFINKTNKLHKLLIFQKISIFLDLKTFLNIFLINKNFNQNFHLIKVLLKQRLLFSNINLNERIILWKRITKYESIKKQINYKQLLNEALLNLNEEDKSIIMKDVERTFFNEEPEKNQKKLENILITSTYYEKELGYFQGMNYIIGFIMHLLNYNEEETFYLYLSLIKNTDFKMIYKNNLELLNKYIYFLKKYIELYTPKIAQYLKENIIDPSFFCQTWFLTLFTKYNSYFNINNYPKSIVFIFENFILDGYIAIFRAGITFLNYYQNKMILMEKDRFLKFLINDMSQDMITNENFNLFRNLFEYNKNLINFEDFCLLENIYNFEIKINEENNN